MVSTSVMASIWLKIFSGYPVTPTNRALPRVCTFRSAGMVSFGYLGKIPVFVVVRLNDVDVVHLKAPQALIHACRHTIGGEVELRVAVSADFCRQKIPVARHSLQCLPQNRLGLRIAVER